MLISIEGNIGTGKSSMLDNLRIYISEIFNNPNNIRDLQNKKILEDKGVVSMNNIAFLPELVDEWVQLKDNNNKNNLRKKYKFSLLGDSNQGLSGRTSGTITPQLQEKLRGSV